MSREPFSVHIKYLEENGFEILDKDIFKKHMFLYVLNDEHKFLKKFRIDDMNE